MKSLAVFFIAGISMWGVTAAAADAAALARDAAKFTLSTSFKASGKDSGGSPRSYIAQNGTVKTNYLGGANRQKSRIIMAPPELSEYSWVWGKDGLPEGGKIIHIIFSSNTSMMNAIFGILDDKRFSSGSYQIYEDSFAGAPCYRIKITYPTLDEAIAKAPFSHFCPMITRYIVEQLPRTQNGQLSFEDFMENRETLVLNYFAVLELWVDKTPNRPFIYRYRAYNPSGKLVTDRSWGDKVEFLTQLEPDALALPKAKVINTANIQESMAKHFDAYGTGYPAPPGKVQQAVSDLGAWTDNNFSTISSWGSRITLCLAILAAIIAVVLKIRSRQRLSGSRGAGVRHPGNGRGGKQ